MTERIIALVAGESGAGKSFFAAQIRQALIYDTDIGGGLSYADARIKRNGSERIEACSYPQILEDLKTREQTGQLDNVFFVVLDHLSTLQQEAVIRHNPGLKKDFGASGDKGAREWRKIREFCRNQDFNILCTAHLKARWEGEVVTGLTAEASRNVESDFHVVMHVRRTQTYPSIAWIQKWRRDPEDERGPIPETMPLTIEAFEHLAGNGMFSPRVTIELATSEQLLVLEQLIEKTKLPVAQIDKWLNKAGIDAFSQMTKQDTAKCIDYLRRKGETHGVPLQS